MAEKNILDQKLIEAQEQGQVLEAPESISEELDLNNILDKQLAEEEEVSESNDDFYDNIASELTEDKSLEISAALLDSISEDIKARDQWLGSAEKVKKYLGFDLEDTEDLPYDEATRTFDTTLSTALIKFYSVNKAELLPPSGPAGFKLSGKTQKNSEDSEGIEEAGEEFIKKINEYLTVEDKGYYSDFDQCLLHLGLYGSAFKKIYFDSVQQKPFSRFIRPHDFVVNIDCNSILDSNRLTHIKHVSKRDVLFRQESGEYLDIELPYTDSEYKISSDDTEAESMSEEDASLDGYKHSSLFPIYEVHTYLSSEQFTDPLFEEETIPLPYIITIDKSSKKILSIVRNWKENDKLKNKINYFVQYNYLPGFGVYGIGLAQLIGTNAITLSRILRQLVDAGALQNLPSGFKVKGLKQSNTDLNAGPGVFTEIDTNGMDIRECFLQFPFQGPSQTLQSLRQEIVLGTKELAGSSELGMTQSKEAFAPETALMLLEETMQMQSAVMRSLHHSLSLELQMFSESFQEYFTDEQVYSEDVSIIPVSNPAVNSTAQKMIRSQAVMQIAEKFPQSHQMNKVLKFYYQALGLKDDEILDLLIQDEEESVKPLDPVTENANFLRNKPAKAVAWQNHRAHKLVHSTFAESNPELGPVIMAHIREHEAFEYIAEMQQITQIEIPPEEYLENPEVQNKIAMVAEQKLKEFVEQQEQQQQENAPPTNEEILMADVEQKSKATDAKVQMEKAKLEVEVFKAQLQHEEAEEKRISDERIAVLRAKQEQNRTASKR